VAHKIKVVARSRNEVQLKLYVDRKVYEVLLEYARPLCISPLDLIRAVLADRFPETPSQELEVGPRIEGKRAPKQFTDNRPDMCMRVGCGHSWGAHNYGAQGEELPDGGPCIECAANQDQAVADNPLINVGKLELCGRFV